MHTPAPPCPRLRSTARSLSALLCALLWVAASPLPNALADEPPPTTAPPTTAPPTTTPPTSAIPLPANPDFAALAYDPTTDAIGFSSDHLSADDADRTALSRCGQPGCEVLLSFHGGCGALAINSPQNTHAAAAPSRPEAQDQALALCNLSEPGCFIKAWTCNDNLGTNFAALAYFAPEDRFGFSSQRATAAEALQSALQFCGPQCVPVLAFKDGCGAYATGSEGIAGHGLSDSKEAAQSAALIDCAYNGGSECAIRTWTCN
jgi:hypothetical protein